MKRLFFWLLLASIITSCSVGRHYDVMLRSDGGLYKVLFHYKTNNEPVITLFSKDKQVFTLENIALRLRNKQNRLGRILSVRTGSRTDTFNFVVPYIMRHDVETYKYALIRFANGMGLEMRLYNNGFAYRWILNYDTVQTIINESLSIKFDTNAIVYFPKEHSLQSSYQRVYVVKKITKFKPESFASLPLMVKLPSGISFVVTDADVFDYPNMFLKVNFNRLNSLFPKYVLETKPDPRAPDRDQIIVRKASFIARVKGHRPLPWRVFALAQKDYQLLTNQLVYELSEKRSKIKDFSWVKPGKVVWDWWNDWQLQGVNFKPGINTRTYEFYIDFAAKYHIPYVLLDEGWSRTTTDLFHFKPGLDLKYLVKYAQTRNVRLILWMLWGPLNRHMTAVMDSMNRWHIAGIKVDFMDRADQEMVDFYWKTAACAAKHHLFVDFHGTFKPIGIRRSYPNVLSFEGVVGEEHYKWQAASMPDNNVMIPYIRNVAGPMDYTPGGMLNTTAKTFVISYSHPRVIGTRTNELAKYIVYVSPLQMLADSPTNYLKNPKSTEFISQISTVWDTTVALAGQVGKYVVVARRRGKRWYLGAMNGLSPREIHIKLSFLPEGQYRMKFFADVRESNQIATAYQTGVKQVTSDSVLNIYMAWGGGFAAIFQRIDR